MLIGYARLLRSNAGDAAIHIDALQKAGCERVYHDELPVGENVQRPAFQRLVGELKTNDVVLVPTIDQFTRSIREFSYLLQKIEARGAFLRALHGPVDTSKPAAAMLRETLQAFAAYERQMLRERTLLGREKAARRGTALGRRHKLGADLRRRIIDSILTGEMIAADAARRFNVHPSTVCRMLAQARLK